MAQSPSEYSKIAAQFAAAKAKAEEERASKVKVDEPVSAAIHFKTRHILAIIFFSWFLYVIF
jgi:hypothetical protein